MRTIDIVMIGGLVALGVYVVTQNSGAPTAQERLAANGPAPQAGGPKELLDGLWNLAGGILNFGIKQAQAPQST